MPVAMATKFPTKSAITGLRCSKWYEM